MVLSKGHVSLQLNELFISECVLGMLEAKDYQWFNVMTPCICLHVDKVTGYNEDAKLTKVSTTYFELLFKLFSKSPKSKRYFKVWM